MSFFGVVERDHFRKATVYFWRWVFSKYTVPGRASTDELNKAIILPEKSEFRPTLFADKGYVS